MRREPARAGWGSGCGGSEDRGAGVVTEARRVRVRRLTRLTTQRGLRLRTSPGSSRVLSGRSAGRPFLLGGGLGGASIRPEGHVGFGESEGAEGIALLALLQECPAKQG